MLRQFKLFLCLLMLSACGDDVDYKDHLRLMFINECATSDCVTELIKEFAENNKLEMDKAEHITNDGEIHYYSVLLQSDTGPEKGYLRLDNISPDAVVRNIEAIVFWNDSEWERIASMLEKHLIDKGVEYQIRPKLYKGINRTIHKKDGSIEFE